MVGVSVAAALPRSFGHLKDRTSMLGQIAASIIGVAVVIIAWQQWQVCRNKLRLDLFDGVTRFTMQPESFCL